MSAVSLSRLHKFARAAIAAAAGGTFVGLQANGYVDGAETTIGVDAGLMRDAVSAILAAAAMWYPRFTRFRVFWRSLTNDGRVEHLEAEVTRLKSELKNARANETQIGSVK